MRPDIRSIGIGMLAGAATVVLCLGVAAGSQLSFLLYFLSAIPLMVVALGWGTVAAIAGAVSAAALIGAITGPEATLYIVTTTIIPAAGAGYLLNLARPAEEIGGPRDALVWYPLSDVVFRLALISGAAFVLAGILVGYGPELVAQIAEESFARVREMNPEFAPSDEARAGLTAFLTHSTAFIQPALWVMILVGNLYLALAATRISGRLRRPREDWGVSLRMPRLAAAVFGAMLVASFVSGPFGLAATAIAGALAGGFVLAGLSVMHERTRGKPWQPLALFAAYAGLFVLIGALPLLLIGITTPARAMPVSPSGRPPAPPAKPQ